MGWASVAHRYWTAYARQGRHVAARAVSAEGGGQPEPLRRPPDPQIRRQERVRVTERPHRDHLGGPRTEAGQRRELRPRRLPVAVEAERQRTVGQRRDQGGQRGAPTARQGQRLRVQPGERLRGGEEVGQPAQRILDRLPVRGDQPGRVRTRRRGGDLLAQHRPYGELRRVDRTGHPAPGGLVHERGQQRVGAQLLVDRLGVGVQVEHPAAPTDGDGEVAQVGQREPAADVVGLRGQGDDAGAVGQAQRATVGAVTPLLDPGDGGRGEVPEEVVGVQRGPERQPQTDRPGDPGRGVPAAAGLDGPLPQLARGQGEDLADRVVEGPDGGEPGGEGHVAHRELGGLDEQSGGLGALGPGQGERTGPELGVQLPLDLAGRVAQPGGQARHALAVHHAVLDQPHRARDGVGAGVPLGRTGTCVGPAPLAGPEPGLLAGGGAGQEGHVLDLRRHGGAAGAAVDPGGQDGGEEPAVEAGVLRLHGPYAALGVGVHGSRIRCRGTAGWRFSDIKAIRVLRVVGAGPGPAVGRGSSGVGMIYGPSARQ